jgi:sugar O-acyltransferase (sialic acid O-acetyltransferase NeuD family)
MKKGIIIIGAGGHGKVVADAILKANSFELIGFVDANTPIGTTIFSDYKVIERQENVESLINDETMFVLGIGNTQIRENISKQLSSNISWATIIHPSAIIGKDVNIGKGSVVLANVVINIGSKVGDFAIVDSGVIIDHDCEIGNFCHLSIGTVIGSNSNLKSAGLKTELGQVFAPFSSI